MNTDTILSFIVEYGNIELIVGLLVMVGWFAYDETQKVTNKVDQE